MNSVIQPLNNRFLGGEGQHPFILLDREGKYLFKFLGGEGQYLFIILKREGQYPFIFLGGEGQYLFILLGEGTPCEN